MKKVIIGIIIGIVTVIALLIVFVLVFGNMPRNIGMSNEELIYQLEKIGYTFSYSETDDMVENIRLKYNIEALTGGNFDVSKLVDEQGEAIMFQDKSLNTSHHFFYYDGDDDHTISQEEKKQEFAYKDFLELHGISEKQLIDLMNYTYSQKYSTSKPSSY